MEYQGPLRPVRIFPILYSIKDFLVHDHPVHHPDTTSYKKYWREQERRCIEGFWAKDTDGVNGGWRYMPGCLYYYVNFCEIADEDESGNTTANIRPLLRDVEWMFAYVWTCARGFSGFKEDKQRSCSNILGKIHREGEESLTDKERFKLKKIKSSLIKEDGSWKTYVDPVDYLYNTHNENLGLPLYDNDAKNLFWLGSRGTGKSFSAGNMVVGHEYNFFGKKYMDETYLEDPAGVEIFVGSALATKSSDLLKKFLHTQEVLKKKYGAWGGSNEFRPGYFALNTTGSLQPNNSASPYRHEYKYSENNTWMVGGTGTKIHHGVYTVENPQAAVGTRPTVMVVEEVGLLKNMLEVHAANETCMIRRNKFGSALYIGTGGNMEKIVEPQIVFEDPAAYNCLAFKDVWEDRIRPIGFFMPAYYVDNDFKDEVGNTDIEAAFAHEMSERKRRESSNNSFALDGYMMARPLIPSEMFLSRDARIFPVTAIRKRLSEVLSNDLWKLKSSIGELHWKNDDVVWREDVNRKLHPIVDLNIEKYIDVTGAIVVYEHPDGNTPPPTYRRSLYKIVYDPVKDDNGGTSLASILVYKGIPSGDWNGGLMDTIVAEYVGRYDDVEKIHDVCVKLATYYNAKILPETNIPDFVRYCKKSGKAHLLQPSPFEAISRVIKNPGRKYDVGVQMTSKALNTHCEQLVRTWLLQEWGGEETYTNIDKIYSLRLLHELIHYNREGNFDSISSLKLLALWLSQEQDYEIAADYQRESDVDLKRRRIAEKRKYLLTQLASQRSIERRPYHVY